MIMAVAITCYLPLLPIESNDEGDSGLRPTPVPSSHQHHASSRLSPDLLSNDSKTTARLFDFREIKQIMIYTSRIIEAKESGESTVCDFVIVHLPENSLARARSSASNSSLSHKH
jgi:hypothetical protein